MSDNNEDFKLYLYYNNPKDYASYTAPNIEESARYSIQNRHKSAFELWQKLAREPWLLYHFGHILPLEITSGQIPFDTLRNQIIIEINNKPQPNPLADDTPILIYNANNTITSCHLNEMQIIQISNKKKAYLEAGLSEENTKKFITQEIKAENYKNSLAEFHIPQEKSAPIYDEARTINLVEQFADLQEKVDKAQNQEEAQKAEQQLFAFLKVNAEELYNHQDLIEKIFSEKYSTEEPTEPLEEEPAPAPVAVSKNKPKKHKKKKAKNLAQAAATTTISETTTNTHQLATELQEFITPKEDATTIDSECIFDYLQHRLDAEKQKQQNMLQNYLSAHPQAISKCADAPEISETAQSLLQYHTPADILEWNNQYLEERAAKSIGYKRKMKKAKSTLRADTQTLDAYHRQIQQRLEAELKQATKRLQKLSEHSSILGTTGRL